MKSRHALFPTLLAVGAGWFVPTTVLTTQVREALASERGATTTGSTATPEGRGFALRSPVVVDGGTLPKEFTGDGASVTPPLEWSGAPAGTRSYALIMHHIDPEGLIKWYWTLYNIPSEVCSLPKDVQGVGVSGNNSVNRRLGYAPPHSKGPGAKTYVLTVYALSAPIQISAPPAEVNRAVLLAAMKDITLASAELKVVYTRVGATGDQQQGPGGDGKRRGERKQ
jgi:Raf kinase inhibitor-like YbhB/YbcL family protein